MTPTPEDEDVSRVTAEHRRLALKLATSKNALLRGHLRGEPIFMGDVVREADAYVGFLRGGGDPEDRIAALVAADRTAGSRVRTPEIVERAAAFLKFLRGVG